VLHVDALTRPSSAEPGHRSGATVDELLTPEEVADRLRTSLRFVRRLVHERRIGFTKVGKYVRITVADVDAFLAEGRVEPGLSYVRSNVHLGPVRSRSGR
jgi:excisionase family DNA binding protein